MAFKQTGRTRRDLHTARTLRQNETGQGGVVSLTIYDADPPALRNGDLFAVRVGANVALKIQDGEVIKTLATSS